MKEYIDKKMILSSIVVTLVLAIGAYASNFHMLPTENRARKRETTANEKSIKALEHGQKLTKASIDSLVHSLRRKHDNDSINAYYEKKNRKKERLELNKKLQILIDR